MEDAEWRRLGSTVLWWREGGGVEEVWSPRVSTNVQYWLSGGVVKDNSNDNSHVITEGDCLWDCHFIRTNMRSHMVSTPYRDCA